VAQAEAVVELVLLERLGVETLAAMEETLLSKVPLKEIAWVVVEQKAGTTTPTARVLSMAVEVAAVVPQRIMTPLEMGATPFSEQAEAEVVAERASPTLARVVPGEHMLQAGAVLVAHPAVPLARLAETTYLGVAMEVVAGRVV